MKKTLLFAVGLSLSILSYGQVSLKTLKDQLVKSTEEISGQTPIAQKGGGDVFWSTTFDWEDTENPSGWSLPDGWTIVDNTDLGMPWMWRAEDDTLRGTYGNAYPPSDFITAEDGFICVAADEYNSRDGVVTDNAVDTYIQTPSIDCSDKSSVVVKFNQLFRTCCGSVNMSMRVTNDDGVHWAEYRCDFNLGNNRVTDPRYRTVQFNISDVAAGMSNIQVQFYWEGSSHYYWMIDDLQFEEAYENELVLEDYWTLFNTAADDNEGHINYWPVSQYGGVVDGDVIFGSQAFRGALLNIGSSDQYGVQMQMTVMKNGEEVYQELSETTSIWALERDTVSITENPFIADGYGDYVIDFEAISESTDEVPENNNASVKFTLNDTLMHRADFSSEGYANTSGFVGGHNSGDFYGTTYPVYASTEVNSISAYLVDDPNMPDDYDLSLTAFVYHIMKWMPEEDDYISILTSELEILDSTMIDSWVTLDLEKDGENEFLEPGYYVAAVEMIGEGGNGMALGWDKDTKFAPGATYMYMFDDEPGWSNPGDLAMIGMNLNEQGGPTEASVTFNVDMNAHIASGEFIPGTDFVDVAGTFNDWTGSEALSDEDGDGIYTITLDGFTIAGKIEYKYRINANWDTSEFPDGGPNRTYTIRYWNVLDNVYNNGETVGVEFLSLIESINVYPNPTKGEFTVAIVNSEVSDMEISLMDIQGHVVFKTHVTGISHTEVISQDLNQGVYFLSVNNGKEVIVEKVLIQ